MLGQCKTLDTAGQTKYAAGDWSGAVACFERSNYLRRHDPDQPEPQPEKEIRPRPEAVQKLVDKKLSEAKRKLGDSEYETAKEEGVRENLLFQFQQDAPAKPGERGKFIGDHEQVAISELKNSVADILDGVDI